MRPTLDMVNKGLCRWKNAQELEVTPNLEYDNIHRSWRWGAKLIHINMAADINHPWPENTDLSYLDLVTWRYKFPDLSRPVRWKTKEEAVASPELTLSSYGTWTVYDHYYVYHQPIDWGNVVQSGTEITDPQKFFLVDMDSQHMVQCNCSIEQLMDPWVPFSTTCQYHKGTSK